MQNQISLKQYAPLTAPFLKAYIITMRPYLLYVSGITGIAGLAFTTELTIAKIILVGLASFLSYGFGQALTDCFQIDTDSLSSPYRPLTQGVVSKKDFLALSSAGLLFCISIFTNYNPINILLGILSGFGLLTYTYFKKKFWSGPFYNAWIVVLLCIMAFLCGPNEFSKIIKSDFAFVILVVFFGYANFVLSGYFKDIEADRATGYITLPVKYGRKVSTIVSDLFAFLMLFFAAIIILLEAQKVQFTSLIPATLFLALGLTLAIISQLQLHRVRTDDASHSAITLAVHSYVLTLSGLASIKHPEWSLFLVLFYIGFNLTMLARPAKNQI